MSIDGSDSRYSLRFILCHNKYLQNRVDRKEKKMLTVLGLEHAMNCICNLKMAYFLADESLSIYDCAF